jgi:hypothetical protein
MVLAEAEFVCTYVESKMNVRAVTWNRTTAVQLSSRKGRRQVLAIRPPALRMCGRWRLYVFMFLNFTTGRRQPSATRSGCFTPGGSALSNHTVGCLMDPQQPGRTRWRWGEENFFVLAGNRIQVVCPVFINFSDIVRVSLRVKSGLTL